jgi:hypothetical protein
MAEKAEKLYNLLQELNMHETAEIFLKEYKSKKQIKQRT